MHPLEHESSFYHIITTNHYLGFFATQINQLVHEFQILNMKYLQIHIGPNVHPSFNQQNYKCHGESNKNIKIETICGNKKIPQS
jgi:hypothetical protein